MRFKQNSWRYCDVADQLILSMPAEAEMKAQVTLMYAANFYQDGTLKLYSALVQFPLERHITDDKYSEAEHGIRQPKKRIHDPGRRCLTTWDEDIEMCWTAEWTSLEALFGEAVAH